MTELCTSSKQVIFIYKLVPGKSVLTHWEREIAGILLQEVSLAPFLGLL